MVAIKQIQFAEQNRSGLFQSHNDFCVSGRNTVLEHAARGSGAYTRSVDVVLQRNWNPMRRTAELPTFLLRFHFTSCGKGLIARDVIKALMDLLYRGGQVLRSARNGKRRPRSARKRSRDEFSSRQMRTVIHCYLPPVFASHLCQRMIHPKGVLR